MKVPWQPFLQLGVVHNMAFPECLGGDGPLFDTLQHICHDPFFEAVDVGPINDPAERRRCGDLLRDCRMTVMLACQSVQLRGQHDLNAALPVERNRAIQAVLDCLDQAPELHAGRVALMSGKNVAGPGRAGAVERLIDSLRQICKAARDRAGVPVVLEIFDYDVDKKALIGPCTLAAELAREVRRDFPDFGLLHDLSHIYLCHESPAQHLPLIREHLVAVHMGSSVSDPKHPLYGDTHPHFGMAGGDSDVPQIQEWIRTLFDIGFLRPGRRPVCGFELKPPPGVSSLTVLANMKRTWEKAWWTLGA